VNTLLTLSFLLNILLYVLGMQLMVDWLPQIGKLLGRPLTKNEEVKLILSWPWLALKDLVCDLRGSKNG
jgi:hypothetical protein